MTGKMLFAQLMDFPPQSTFGRIVARYHADRLVQTRPWLVRRVSKWWRSARRGGSPGLKAGEERAGCVICFRMPWFPRDQHKPLGAGSVAHRREALPSWAGESRPTDPPGKHARSRSLPRGARRRALPRLSGQLGFRQRVHRPTLADANGVRVRRTRARFGQRLMVPATELHARHDLMAGTTIRVFLRDAARFFARNATIDQSVGWA